MPDIYESMPSNELLSLFLNRLMVWDSKGNPPKIEHALSCEIALRMKKLLETADAY